MSSSSTPKSTSKPLSPDQVAGYFNQIDTLTGGSHVAPTTTRVWVPDAPGTAGESGGLVPWLGGEGETAPAGHYETRTTAGSDTAGRLSAFATQGTPAVAYQGAGPGGVARAAQIGDQAAAIRALGGYGSTQAQQQARARRDALAQISADAGLDVTQKARSRQLTDNDYADRLAAIARESEAQIAQGQLGVASANAGFQQQTNLANQQAALAEARQRYAADVANAQLPRQDMESLAKIFFGGQGQTQSGGGTSSSVDAAKAAEVALAAAAFFSSEALKQDVEPLAADGTVLQLEPVTYRWREGTEALRAGHDGTGLDVGLIAEEVAAVLPALVVRDADGNVTGVRYHLLPVLLLHADQLIDAAAELVRLEKEAQKVDKELQTVQGRMANPDFVARAKPEVVEQNRARIEELTQRLAELFRHKLAIAEMARAN